MRRGLAPSRCAGPGRRSWTAREQDGALLRTRQGGDGGQGLALQAKLAVGVVLEQPEVVRGELAGERLAALEREGSPGRVLERRDAVDEPRAVGRRELADRLGQQAVVVGRDGDGPRAGEREDLQGREVGRVLDEHRVARLE